jgi:hypothetical protein
LGAKSHFDLLLLLISVKHTCLSSVANGQSQNGKNSHYYKNKLNYSYYEIFSSPRLPLARHHYRWQKEIYLLDLGRVFNVPIIIPIFIELSKEHLL